MKKYISFTLVFNFFVTFLFAQNLSERIGQSFSELQNDSNIKNGIVSLTVMDSRSGEIIFAKNENIGLATASTMKAITTATAYAELGADFTYKTDLLYSGSIEKNGVLHGDIIIQGSGDPTLGSARYDQTKESVILNQWIHAIKAKGIKKINGKIIGDDRLFNGNHAPSGWTWVDMGNYYGAGVSSLNWRENSFKVRLTSGPKVGDPVELVNTVPDVSYLTILNEVTTGKAGSGDQVYAYSAPYSSIVHLRGTYGIDLNKEIVLSLPDGAFDVAFSLQNELIKQGIAVTEMASTAFLLEHSGFKINANPQFIASHQSPKLSDIADRFNKISINLYGEALLKTIAVKEGIATETGNITRWEEKYWEEKLGILPGELRIRDGSGLSPEIRVTTSAMTKILNYATTQPWYADFIDNMPTYNGMKMKSGTISSVLGYAGYHQSADGTPLVFSLLINNYQGSAPQMRQKMFKMLNSLK